MYQPARYGYPGLVREMEPGPQEFCFNTPGPRHVMGYRCDCYLPTWKDGKPLRVWVACE